MRKEKPPYDFEKDKLRLMFKDHKEIFNFFHIDFKTGIIYNKNLWDKGVPRECGRPIGEEYLRVSVTKNGKTIDVLAHRLIFYAYYGYLFEKIDHADKTFEYQNAISNLRRSDAIHNRANVKKVKRKRVPLEQRLDKRPDRQRTSEKYVGVYKAHGFYWAKYKSMILNKKGFISEILASNFRNNFIVKEYEKTYKDQGIFDFPPYPKSGLDFIDHNELFLDQMIQEAVEKTEEYKNEHEKIELNNKIKFEKQKAKISTLYKQKVEEEDSFDCIGKYDT